MIRRLTAVAAAQTQASVVAPFMRAFTASRRPPAVPPETRVYAVGDIHGCSGLLERLLEMIAHDTHGFGGQAHLVFLGDYIDRGPDSKGVVERLIRPIPGFACHFVRGNHDQALIDFLNDAAFYSVWRKYGGTETLLSYGVSPPRFETEAALWKSHRDFANALSEHHRNFFRSLSPSVTIGDYFFTHAGVRPGVALEHQELNDLMWIREPFLSADDDFGKVVVHGHEPALQPVRRKNRIGIDTGAYATGRLSVAVLQGQDCRFFAT
ncbi:MAG: metallophosphoesterase family protein [Alphaproteobacteria bacterium]